jgi:Fe-S cluster assembly iron-binding protein IscA
MWHENLADGFDKPGTAVVISEKENQKNRIKLNNQSTNTWDIALCLARRASKQQDVGFESCRNYILLDYMSISLFFQTNCEYVEKYSDAW